MSEIKHYVYPPIGVEHYGEIIDSKDNYDVSECKTCGFKYVIPISTPEELDKLYIDELKNMQERFMGLFYKYGRNNTL